MCSYRKILSWVDMLCHLLSDWTIAALHCDRSIIAYSEYLTFLGEMLSRSSGRSAYCLKARNLDLTRAERQHSKCAVDSLRHLSCTSSIQYHLQSQYGACGLLGGIQYRHSLQVLSAELQEIIRPSIGRALHKFLGMDHPRHSQP